MKKNLFVFIGMAMIILMATSCSKEKVEDQRSMETLLKEDNPELRIGPGPARPDLIISDYFTNIGALSTLCTDTLMESTHCDVGPRTFTASVDIDNIGAAAVPPGTIDVFWYDWTWGLSSINTYPHNGIPIGGQITVSRQYYVGPCDCVQIPRDGNCFIHRYQAFVDPNFLIIELNENNNISELHEVCDGCGPCSAQPSEPAPELSIEN